MARTNEKQQAHDLIERLAPGQISALVHLLEVMTDPVGRSLANAPVDDEPVTEQEASEIAPARASLDRGEGIPHEQVLAEFGLTSNLASASNGGSWASLRPYVGTLVDW
jgi:hypothetical protein